MSHHPAEPAPGAVPARRPLTLPALREMAARGEPIAALTAYDAIFARAADAAGVDLILVGDSLGMVLQGHGSTLPVTLDDMAYHLRCTARGLASAAGGARAWLVGDLPHGSYHEGPAQAMRASVALMQAGAQMVKLEGGGWTAETVRFLVERGVPVCAHLGLTPQSVHALGGYRVQGREAAAAERLQREARELADAGAALLVLELVPAALARAVTEALPQLPTIGIGAGRGCSGQVLVLHDMLGLTPGRRPRFVRNFMEGASGIDDALRRYVTAVKDGSFPEDALHAH